jgi:hypothetical protein
VLVLAVLTALAALGAPTIVLAQPAVVRTFRDLGYDDRTVHSVTGGLSYNVPLPRGQSLRPGAHVEIEISHSPLLLPDESTMTIAAGGRNVTSAFLTDETRDRGRIVVPLPVEALGAGGFTIQISFHLRSSRGECEDPYNPALWATVHQSSTVVLPLARSGDSVRLQDLPDLLLASASGTDSEPLRIAVPAAGTSAEELEAAGLVAFQYGRWAVGTGVDPIVEAAPVTSVEPHGGILVGTGSALSIRGPAGAVGWNGQSFVVAGGILPGDHGLLALASRERPLLIVGGATPEAVRTAAEALVQPERRDLLYGDHAIVSGENVAWNDGGRPWRYGAASFAQLGVARQDVIGPGEHAVRLHFERPPGWVLRDGGTLDLGIAVTPGARSGTSWVSVRLNGIELGSQWLDAEDNGVRRYRFPLPAEQLNATLDGVPLRRLDLDVRFFLGVEQSRCVSSSQEGMEATLLPSSAWRLPHDQYRGMDLGRFPAMFFGATAPRVSVVLPDQPSPAELSAGMTMMAGLGYWSGSDDVAWPRLVTAGNLSDRDRRADHLILVGGPETSRVSDAASRLDRTLFESHEPPLYGQAGVNAARWGMLNLGRSPWGRSRLVLAITDSDRDGVGPATAALVRTGMREQIRGRTVVITEALPPQVLVGAQPAAAPPRDLAPRADGAFRDRLQPWQIAGVVLLGLFGMLVAGVLVIRLQRRTEL